MDEVFLTDDGSHSILSDQFQVSYHSTHGAIQESNHVFLDAGLSTFPLDQPIHLLEVGFGTGLNALLTAMACRSRQAVVHYTTLERYPLAPAVIESLNYTDQLPDTSSLFTKIHQADWGVSQNIEPHFRLLKREMDFLQLEETGKYDLIYFDAFAPTAQPELWTTEALRLFVRSMKVGGKLTTYCAKGVVRRSFLELGCTVERLAGPPGKREMLRITRGEGIEPH